MSDFQINIDSVTVNGSVSNEVFTEAVQGLEQVAEQVTETEAVDQSMWPMVTVRPTGGFDTPGTIRVQPGMTVTEALTAYNDSDAVGSVPANYAAAINNELVAPGYSLQFGQVLEFVSRAKSRG